VSSALKKQNSIALSTVEAEYIVAGHYCVQLPWMRQTLRDYGYKLSKVPLLCDNESAIRMVDNPVEHSRTKHIDIRYHFLRDHQQKGVLGTFGVRRSSKTGFNSISGVQCVNRYPRTKVGIAVDQNNTKVDTKPKVRAEKLRRDSKE
jgi:hypothetical protein